MLDVRIAGGGGEEYVVVAGGLVWEPDRAGWTERDVHMRGGVFVEPAADGPSPDRVVDAHGRLVVPGLVNAHTHAHNNLLKGTGDCRYLEGHINAMAAVGGWTPRDLYLSTMVGIVEMLTTGTTTAYDMVRAPTDEHVAACVQAYRDAGMRAVVAPAVSDVPLVDTIPGLAGRLPEDELAQLRGAPPSREEALALAERAVRTWHGVDDGRIQVAVGPLIADSCSDELIADAAALARDLGVGTHMHLLESKTQALQGLVRGGGRPWVEHLDSLGYLGPRATFAHAVWLTPPEVATLAAHGATVVHNPASNLKIGSGLAPVSDYRSAGLAVALATDGAASGDSLDMFGAMWLAALLSHSRTPDPSQWLTSVDVVEMATCVPGRALGLDGSVGAIRPGAVADLVVIDPAGAAHTPLNDPTVQLVYAGTGRSVERVVVGGSVVMEHGVVHGVDAPALLEEAREAARRLGVRQGMPEGRRRLQLRLDEWQRGLREVPYPVDRYTAR